MEGKTPLLCVVGPTASGKTGLAVELALRYGGEVVSADSMQIYRRMNIGTAKPTQEETRGIAHHCIDLIEPDDDFSVALYVKHARAAIADITARGKRPILAGGTGLYVSSLCDNITFSPMPGSEAIRAELTAFAQKNGNEALWEELRRVDPPLAAALHPNNLGRVMRALEVWRLTGVTMTEHQRHSRLAPCPYHVCMLGITYEDRAALYARINRRVDLMLEQGLLDEIKALSQAGYSKTAAQAIGYKEFFGYLSGQCTLNEAAERVKQESRRYAKRQLTWFRRDERVRWLCADGAEPLLQQAARVIEAELGWQAKS